MHKKIKFLIVKLLRLKKGKFELAEFEEKNISWSNY